MLFDVHLVYETSLVVCRHWQAGDLQHVLRLKHLQQFISTYMQRRLVLQTQRNSCGTVFEGFTEIL
eukprot:NODE_1401_length_609_cov_231.650000_g1113_i0.p2 GENE.NODE_1401_length_609_cov_231.650000_g1113_i0~~NODE_1401_length_609_cov_231.650000_g1113_i0.p2  ORF type:complete len:66 (-),score=1.86 NODE_1401_length_609_cov_231.650000_g1113_i0:236-433(-)